MKNAIIKYGKCLHYFQALVFKILISRVHENDSILSVIENADESMYKVKAEKKKNEKNSSR